MMVVESSLEIIMGVRRAASQHVELHLPGEVHTAARA
jgi:hypothetical protein